MVKGKRVGKYELGRTLGSGSFSKVKLGMDEKGAQYAVKIIDKEQLVREKLEEQLKREISIMRMMNHPNIVRLYDVLQTSNNIYLVLELVTGGELFDRIVSAKRFDEDTARRYFQQMVVALDFCHRQGVAHRDLKPENLLVDERGDIKITDFGLASLQEGNDKKLLRTVCGTPNYVAPEVLKEQGYVGSTADVWSCGVILYVMLAGSLPFDDPQLNVLFGKIERGEYKMPRTFANPVRDIISKMLTLDPKKRPSLGQIMEHPWFQKNWDRTVYNSLSGCLVVPEKESTWGRTECEKESKVLHEDPDSLGAFELIQNLSMVNINCMTTNRPVIKIFTRFITGLPKKETVEAMVAVLMSINASPKAREDKEIKGFQNKTKGLLTYSINASSLVDPKMTMVDVRRGRGDTFDFHALYWALIEGLGKKVISREITNEMEPSAKPQDAE